MKIFPAIDIKNGSCVRLRQGKFQEMEVYSRTPAHIAEGFEKAGASYIHIVDLDGALVGHSVNDEAIREIVAAVSIPVEVGGGIRTIQDIENKLNLGVKRVILGTRAAREPQFAKEAILSFGAERIVIGIDAKNGMVATDGWEKLSGCHAISLALKMKEMGARTIVYTDISKDGMLSGPNMEHTREMVSATGLNVIASGGVSSMKDLAELDAIPVYGAIIGKALYERQIDLAEAVRKYEA